MERLEFLEFERAIRFDIGVHAGDLAVDRTVGKGCRRRANGAIRTGVDDSGRRTGGVEYTASERGNRHGRAAGGDYAGEILKELELIRTEIGVCPWQSEGC